MPKTKTYKPEKTSKEQILVGNAKLERQKKRFAKARKAFIKAYLKYRDKQPGQKHKEHPYVIKEIDTMLQHVESWKWFQGKQGVPSCFGRKCELIIDAAEKLSKELHKSATIHYEQEERYEMIVVHVGALDLDGYKDKFAVKWAKEIEGMHKDWHMFSFLMRGGREYLFHIWEELHAKFDDCGCRLCNYEFYELDRPSAS